MIITKKTQSDLKEFFSKNSNEITIYSNSEEETMLIANEFSVYLNKSDVLSLDGELGAGKTTLMKGIAKYFNISADISSPTFTIVNEYNTEKFNIYHFDVYRIKNSENFESTIGMDYFYMGLCIIEWGNIIEDILPKNTIYITISKTNDNCRTITFKRRI